MERTKYLVIGGGPAGAYSLQAIRERDPEGRIILVSRESSLPYDRVPLSKGYLVGKVRKESVFLKKPEFYQQNQMELMLGVSAESLNLNSREVALSGGEHISFEKLLLATGGNPRHLAVPGSELEGVGYLRTLEDCERLKQSLSPGKKVAIIGGGFIGCEVAAACIALGVEAIVVEALPKILGLAFDPETSDWVEEHLVGKGLKFRKGAAVTGFRGEGNRLTGVELKDGDVVPADMALVAVGLAPSVELAQKAGLKVEGGIVVDEHLATEAKGIYAAGDVARFWHPVIGRSMRVEHYDVAVKQGRIAGANMAGDTKSFTDPPYFFSYLPGLNINAYGDLAARDAVVRRGPLNSFGFFQFYFADGRMKGFLAVNRSPAELQLAKKLLAAQPALEESRRLTDEGADLASFVTKPNPT